MKFLVFFTVFLAGLFPLLAETLSVPENCFKIETSPCLLKSTGILKLQNSKKKYGLVINENTIIKVNSFGEPFEFELLQGRLTFFSLDKKEVAFKLNEVEFLSSRIFAEITSERKIEVYNVKNFILTEYDPGVGKGSETVISRSEFLSKLDTIRYIANFYSNKKLLSQFLKSIEMAWEKEFKTQTNDQEKTLKRSLASIEEKEAERKRQAAFEAEELKKVRSLFFYRTFYR